MKNYAYDRLINHNCFKRSSVKFQGHTGRKINDLMYLELFWARLLDRSQLSNASDLPCFFFSESLLSQFLEWPKYRGRGGGAGCDGDIRWPHQAWWLRLGNHSSVQVWWWHARYLLWLHTHTKVSGTGKTGKVQHVVIVALVAVVVDDGGGGGGGDDDDEDYYNDNHGGGCDGGGGGSGGGDAEMVWWWGWEGDGKNWQLLTSWKKVDPDFVFVFRELDLDLTFSLFTTSWILKSKSSFVKSNREKFPMSTTLSVTSKFKLLCDKCQYGRTQHVA